MDLVKITMINVNNISDNNLKKHVNEQMDVDELIIQCVMGENQVILIRIEKICKKTIPTFRESPEQE